MSKQSEFEEFIAMKVRPMYQGLEAGTGTQLTQSHVLEAMAEMTANHLIGVCTGWINRNNTEDGVIEMLRKYVQGKDEAEHE